jgi:membrane-associated protease RseP (regulator of RpoE activity)
MNRITLIAFTLGALLVTTFGAAATPLPGDPVKKDRQVVVLKAEGPGGPEGTLPRVMFHSLSGGYLGVRLVDLTPELRSHFGVPDDRGVLVGRIEDDSPAAEAGLAVGDIITEVDGEPMSSTWDVSLAVREHSEGETLDLELWRDGRPMSFTATVRERERERIEMGELLHEGQLRRLHELPDFQWFEGSAGEDGEALLRIRPRIIEELGKVDWPAIQEGLQERNRELEERLKTLEQRLKELEQRLDEAPPQ